MHVEAPVTAIVIVRVVLLLATKRDQALAALVNELAVVEIERGRELPAQLGDQRQNARALPARVNDDRVPAVDPTRLTDRNHHAPDRDPAQLHLILHGLTWDTERLTLEAGRRDDRVGFRRLRQSRS